MGFTCSVVIPVYNSQGTLRELVTRLAKVMPQLCEAYEVILVNDGSRDQSWQEICALAKEYPWTRGINMMRNYGQHNALLCGLRAAKYELTITMDDDLQHPPEEIGILLEKFCDDFDVVYGLPKKLPHSLWRNFFSLLTKPGLWLQRITTQPPTDDQVECAIKALDLAMELEKKNGGELVIA